MPLSLGIVGLPNVGKSTLFNALVESSHAEASNYPFCTIDPNVGSVPVPDERLHALAQIVQPKQVVPASVEFVDIAGLIEGASKGEGLGNQFLGHIRETAAMLLVLRCFEDPDVSHVAGSVNPARDLETLLIELALADLATVEKAVERYRREAKGNDPQAVLALTYCEALAAALAQGALAATVLENEASPAVQRELQLLTAKPFLIIANVSEAQVQESPEALARQFGLESYLASGTQLIAVSAKLEAELAQLELGERAEFLREYGLSRSGLDRLVQAAYRLLGLQTFFTAGPKEVRAWTIRRGWRAPQAAGVIHTDFEHAFIRAEVISYADYVQYGGESGARDAGRLRVEGKEYVVQDGDVLHIRHSA